MNIEQAKPIQNLAIKVLMHTQGIGKISSGDVEAVKQLSLVDMLQANKVMDGYEEKKEDGKTTFFVSTTDKALAELYLRIHDEEFMVASEFEEICSAMDDAFEDTENGHAVLIDATGYYSLIELARSGDCAEETLVTVNTPRELYDYAKNCIAELELAEQSV